MPTSYPDPENPERQIHTYENHEPKPFALPETMAESCEEISDHVEKYVGKVDSVFHELISDLVHIDVLIVKPTVERPEWTLVTSGMSDLPMKAPEGQEELRYAELVIRLPGSWKVGSDEEGDYWPTRLIKMLARFPHEYDTWIFEGHSLDIVEAPETLHPTVPFASAMLWPSVTLPLGFQQLELKDAEGSLKRVHFLSVYPLYAGESLFKRQQGAEELVNRMEQAGITDIVDIRRSSLAGSETVAKKPWWRRLLGQ